MRRAPLDVQMFGFGLGGTLGGLICTGVAWLMLAKAENADPARASPGAGIGLAILFLWIAGGWLVGTALCASLGTSIAVRKWTRTGWRPLGWVAYGLGALPVLAFLTPLLAVLLSLNRTPASSPAPAPSRPTPPPKESRALSKAPAPTPEQLLGSLFYPGAFVDETSSLQTPRKPGDAPWPVIAMVPNDGATEASLRAFYAGLVSGGQEAYGGWKGSVLRPGDGKAATIVVMKALRGPYAGRPIAAAILK